MEAAKINKALQHEHFRLVHQRGALSLTPLSIFAVTGAKKSGGDIDACYSAIDAQTDVDIVQSTKAEQDRERLQAREQLQDEHNRLEAIIGLVKCLEQEPTAGK